MTAAAAAFDTQQALLVGGVSVAIVMCVLTIALWIIASEEKDPKRKMFFICATALTIPLAVVGAVVAAGYSQ